MVAGAFLVVKKPVSYFTIILEFVNYRRKSLKTIPFSIILAEYFYMYFNI